MRKFFANISLRRKIPIIFCVMLSVMILSVGIILYQYYHNTFQKYFKESFNMTITTNVNSIKEIFGTVENAVNLVNNNEEAFVIENKENVSVIVSMIIDTDPSEKGFELHDMCREMESSRLNFDNLFGMASSHGMIVSENYPIARYFRNWNGFTDGFYCGAEMEDVEWYNRALEQNGNIYWFAQENAPNQLFMAKLLKYQYYERLAGYEIRNLGVIVVGIDLSMIEERIDFSEMPDKTQIFIIDEKRDILYSNQEKAKLLSEETIASVMKNGMDGDAYYGEHEGVQYLIQKNEIVDGLYMLTAIPVDAINQMSFRMISILLIILVIALLAGMIFISLISRAMIAPIVRLAEQMRQGIVELVDDEELGRDEIGILYRGYNQMQEKIQEMIQNVWDSAEKRKKAELQYLQAQINPHFIYNSLGSISCYALLNGQDAIARQLNMLASIMRYSIRNPNRLVPLKDEIQLVSQYADFQKMCYDDNVEFNCSVAPECENVLIPKLMIQPLVENSIIHGLDLTKGDARIEVSARMVDENRMIVVVSDNGRGGDMTAINQYIRMGYSPDNEHDSLGVRNVYERIRGVFGHDGTLEYRISPEGNTEAVITIPLWN